MSSNIENKNERLIDSDAAPFIPADWIVESHKKSGLLKVIPEKISLYLSERQSGSIRGNELIRELEKLPVMNANILDYLLAHQELIPVEWKGKFVFFWGTIYRDRARYLSVRYLCWTGSMWYWGSRFINYHFNLNDPAAL